MKTLTVVVGGQFGSEAKGHVTKRLLAAASMPTINVRVAGPNAGHTVYDDNGNKFAFRSMPVGMVLPPLLVPAGYISAGSEIDLPVLLEEIDALRAAGHTVQDRLVISSEATLITSQHKQAEADAALTARVGSTGKGIGAARAARIMRTAPRVGDDQHVLATLRQHGVVVVRGSRPMQHTNVLIEGTQGYGLGLHAGYYPQSTSSDCRAIDFCSMAGINPWEFGKVRVQVVCRVHPIRVAGNSGPLHGETTWEQLGLQEEHTTVTHKVRRVGHWDPVLASRAVLANGRGNSKIALTMADQLVPELANVTDPHTILNHPRLSRFIDDVEQDTAVDVDMITTGPDCGIMRQGREWVASGPVDRANAKAGGLL